MIVVNRLAFIYWWIFVFWRGEKFMLSGVEVSLSARTKLES